MISLFLLNFAQKTNVSEFYDINLYSILGLNKYSTSKEVQRAFKKAFVQHNRNRHPTRRDERAWKHTLFAHDIISNPDSRELYDKFGTKFLNETDFAVSGYKSNREIALIEKSYGGIVQTDKFGGVITFPLQFELSDFINGRTRTVNIMRTVGCTCKRGGTRCPKCRKNPFETQLVTERVTLPKGAAEKHMMYHKDILDSHLDRGATDIVFVAYSKKDENFVRDGVDLRMNATITLADVIDGKNYTFENVDGEELSIPIDGVQHKEERRIKGKGIPYFDNPKTRGDVIVKFFIKFPRKLTKEQIEVVKRNLPDDECQYI